MENLFDAVKQMYLYKRAAYLIHKRAVEKDPVREINRCYSINFACLPNIETPTDLIEKIYWLQLHSDTSLWTLCADKYRVREYIAQNGLCDYLPKFYGKWNKASDIDFLTLPNQFVLKTNNGCEQCVIVKNKSKLNYDKVKRQFKRWLKLPFGYSGYQPHYLKIKPCIIVEELLVPDKESKLISPNSLIDYKIWYINGIPESVLIVYNRNESGYNLDLYDIQWNKLNKYLYETGHYRYQDIIVPKPLCLDKMLEIGKILSKPFPEVRVDFYVIDNKPYIGELSFSTGYGYFTKDYYRYLGSKIDIEKWRKSS